MKPLARLKRENEVADVALGGAIFSPKEHAGQVPGLRMSPVGVVEERENIILIQDTLFEHRHGQGGGSVNATTGWEDPECALAGVMREVLHITFGLRANFVYRVRIHVNTMDVKYACRHPIDPDGPAASDTCWFSTSLSTYACSAGGGVVRGGRACYRRRNRTKVNTTRESVSFSQPGEIMEAHVATAPSTGRPVPSWPPACVGLTSGDGERGHPSILGVFRG